MLCSTSGSTKKGGWGKGAGAGSGKGMKTKSPRGKFNANDSNARQAAKLLKL
jgi:hypothetical protein